MRPSRRRPTNTHINLVQRERLAQGLAGVALFVNNSLEKAGNGKTTNRERQRTREENCDH
jgi:hypothetical protein